MALNSFNSPQESSTAPESPGKFRLVVPLLARRGAAVVLEVSLVAAAVFVPFSLGQWANQRLKERVPLNPVLVQVQETIAKTLALPRSSQPIQVSPITNLLWSGAVILPVLVGSWQLILLAVTGQTSPKRWFAVAVVQADSSSPGILRTLVREGVGRWGLPLSGAYILWRYTGAFPEVTILLTVAGLFLVLEGATALWNYRRHGRARSFHDQLAATYVVDVVWLEDDEVLVSESREEINEVIRSGLGGQGVPSTNPHQQVVYVDGNVVIEQTGDWKIEQELGETVEDQGENLEDLETEITTITLPRPSSFNLWRLMRCYPGTTLLIALLGSMSLILGTFVGTQVYIQGQANQRNLKQQQNELFLSLVQQLNAASNPEARQGAILALGRITDDRVVPLLVDTLSREKTANSIEAIEQALVANGLISLPPLQKLNQALQNDLQTAIRRAQKEEQDLVLVRQKAVVRSITKILAIYAKSPQKIDLNKVDFSVIPAVLEGLDLAGVSLQEGNLFNASLRYSNFFSAGEDGIYDTYDDSFGDFTRANLQQVDFTGTILVKAVMLGSNLSWSAINKADFSSSNLAVANLSGAQIISSKFIQVNLEKASLTGVNLGDSQFMKANFHQANFGKARAVNTDFSSARLTKTNWQAADASQANFQEANLQGSDLSNGRFVGAKFANANLQNVNFQFADLRFADFRGANLAGANLAGVVFFTAPDSSPDQFIRAIIPKETSAIVKQVDFSQVKNLDSKQLQYICTQGGIHPRCP